ncbi:MAG: hypothetical protein WBW04_02040 [Nitrolancea sp.]
MTNLYTLYRQSMPETVNGSPLVLGLFQSVSEAQEELSRTYGGEAHWSPPSPGHRRWELRTARYLYIVEEFSVQERKKHDVGDTTPGPEPGDGSTISIESIRQLTSHVAECLDESAAAARESHENWMLQSSDMDDDHLRRLQGNERYYLGQAAAFAWIAGCLDRLVDQRSDETVDDSDERMCSAPSRVEGSMSHGRQLSSSIN